MPAVGRDGGSLGVVRTSSAAGRFELGEQAEHIHACSAATHIRCLLGVIRAVSRTS
jgi:hypothetical protein